MSAAHEPGRERPDAGLAEPPSRDTWVVVPALDEAARIGLCLDALATAAAQVPGSTHIVLVDDGSTDATASIARHHLDRIPGEHTILTGPGAGVGPARRLGLEHALAAAGHAEVGAARGVDAAPRDDGPAAALIASTDADSRVGPDWIATMHRRLDAGHVVVAGDIALEASTDLRLVAARAARLRTRLAALPPAEAGAPHPHFAGASLGFDAPTLAALRPLPAPRELEDEALLERCRAAGVPVLRDAAVRVHTSARTVGRAAHGLADALATDLAALPTLHLTFDDGPDPVWTPEILAALAEHGATATFFVLGAAARRHPELITAIGAGGHTIGLHGDAHLDHRSAAPEALAADTAAALATLAEQGVTPTLWRLPWGRPGATTPALAAEHGLAIVGWDADTHDWRGDGWADQPAAVLRAPEQGGVVLLHDGRGPGQPRTGCANTVALTRELLTAAREHGTAARAVGPADEVSPEIPPTPPSSPRPPRRVEA